MKVCQLAFQKTLPKDSTTTRGDDVVVRDNALIVIPDPVQSYFNIPVIELPSTRTRKVVKATTYKRYSSIADDTGVQVTRREYETTIDQGGAKGRTIRIPTEKKTDKGNYRTVTLHFPGFFTLLMVQQALGQMIKAHEPELFYADASSLLFTPNSIQGVQTGYFDGAWVVTTPIASQNVGDSNVVGQNTVTGGNKRKASG